MKYQHSFQVNASLEAVAGFHIYSSSMGAITPPPILVQVHQAPQWLGEGDQMDFTLWCGPFPIRWLARIEQVSVAGFTDRQVRGPFRQWVHRHSFLPVNKNATQVLDEVYLELKSHLIWGPVGLLMQLNLPILFAYRGWKTRRILERGR